MTDVRPFHEEVVRPDNCFSSDMSSSVDDHIFANDVIVAHDKFTPLAHETEILWYRSYYRTLMYLVAISHSRSLQNADEWKDNTVVAYDDVILDIGKRIYLTALSNLCRCRNFGSRTYFTAHN